MQYVTEQYRENMKLLYRGASYVYVYVGLINLDAQSNAHITSSFSGDETHLYDGTSASTVTSTESDGSITFTFGDFYELNIAGLQLTFGGTSVPASITVTNGEKTESYETNGETEFSFDDGYTDCHYITITPSSGKLKLQSITFGIGLQFGNKQLLNTTRDNVVSHISNEIPIKKFSFTVDNRLHMFNKDNPYGYADYFQEKQEVIYEYGRELEDGTIYKIKGGKVLLDTWSSDDFQAKFSCVGYLDYMDGQYYKGQYSENGFLASTLAENVFADAGIENYILDPSLKSILINNPIPVCTHREALQMIANACRCTLFEDRDGNICILNANRPSFVGDVTFTGATGYSIPSSLFNDNTGSNYADAEYNYAYADGSLLFLPDDDTYIGTGFISSELADANGLFSNNPSIDISLQSEYHIRQLFFNFGVVVPTSMTITLYLNGNIVDSDTLTNLSISTEYEYEGTIDALKIEFNSAIPNQRIRLNNVEFNGYIDYDITYHELKTPPIANSLEKVSNINVKYYSFAYAETNEKTTVDNLLAENSDGGYTLDIITDKSSLGAIVSTIKATVGDNTVILNTPCHNYSVSAGTIKESGAYYLVVNSDIEQEIIVYGWEFDRTDHLLTVEVHEKGVEKNVDNPLVGTMLMASQLGAWLKDYYDDDLEYDLTYRGDPILDCDDVILLENHFVDLNEIRISEEAISTSLGLDFSCHLLCRRTWYQTNAVVSEGLVGYMLVGDVLE